MGETGPFNRKGIKGGGGGVKPCIKLEIRKVPHVGNEELRERKDPHIGQVDDK